MIHKILGRLASARSFVFAALALAMPTIPAFAVNKSYIDANGDPAVADCTAITSSTTTLETGWYVVEGQLSLYKTFTVSGDVKLILADNAKFTTQGEWELAGINVPSGSSLTIFSQENGTGELNVTGGYYSSGIGGNKGQSCGTVTINGGIVNVTGGDYGAAIGGGNGVSDDPTVGAGGTVTVNGGTVTAHGGNYGAGIGGGYYGNGGTVRVNGGSVTAVSGSDYSAGIGKGAFGSTVNGTLIVGSGLAVLAGASEATATAQTPDPETKEVTLSGQKWFYVGQPSLRQTTSELYASYHEATPINVSLADTIIGGTGPYKFTLTGTYPEWLSVSGTSLVGTPPSSGVHTITLAVEDSSDTPLELDGGATYTLYVQVTGDVPVTFVSEGGASRTETCTVVEKTMTTLNAGWYVVYNDVVFNSTVTVSGDVKLVLMDGKTMTVTATQYKAAVNVAGSGNSLTIYGQANGTGRLEATAVSIAAGIGGNSSQAGGVVTINGGTVVATGNGGAGIGGGYSAAGGVVTINGGTVTASSSGSGAGVGGYNVSDHGSLTVGANVVVKAGSSANPTAVLNTNGETDLTSLLDGQRYFTFETVGPVPLSQATSVLAAYVGQAFNQSLSATVSGGKSPYSFEKTSGTLPDGLEFDAGVISGTPTAAGSANVVITVTDSGEPAQITNFTYTINVTQPPKSITYKDGSDTIYGLSPTQYTPGTATPLAASAPKTGYSFVGWYGNDELVGDIVTEVPASATDDLTFWGRWNLLNYTITYHNVSGVLAPAIYNIETPTFALPTPEVGENETFVGWYTTSAFTGTPVTQIVQGSTGNKDFYARITSNTPEPDPDPSGDGYMPDDPEEPSSGYDVVTKTYMTPSGAVQRKCHQLTSQDWGKTLSDSWYYVEGEVTIESLTIEGNVSLILGDGATLTVGSDYYPGIQLTQGNTLTIYGQSGGTGALVATGGDGLAGIGGGMMMDAQMCGKLNIYGGNITASGGGDWAPGIGSTSSESDSTGQIYIYGGTVTAIGSDYFGGIGGSKWYGQGTLTVGANMTVTAGADAASAVELTPGADGSVTLSAQKYFHIESAADVPLSQSKSALTVTVGDTITLSSTISGGKKPYTFSGSVPSGLTLSGGVLTCTVVGTYNFSLTVTDDDSLVLNATYAVTVERREKTITYIDGTDGETVLTGLTPTEYIPGGSTVYLPNYSAVTNKVGYRFLNWYSTSRLDLDGDSPVYAISSSDTGNKTFYAKFVLQEYPIFYYDFVDGSLTTIKEDSYTINDTPVTLWTPAAKEGYTFGGWCQNRDCSDTPVFTIPRGTAETKQFYVKWVEDVPEPSDGLVQVDFVGASGSPMQQLCTPVTAETATLTNGGWYVVNNNVELGTAELGSSITVEGTVNLVLVDGKSLTVYGEYSSAGINVPSGSSLTIYGQTGGTGAIYATGNDFAAGIGGNSGWDDAALGACGTIVINGGHIEATGGNYGAGIGGGYNGVGGAVTVNGGYVKAASPWMNVPGIGGGGVGSGGVKPGNGTLTVAADIVVKAGLISILDDENIQEADPVTHQITISNSWTNFLIEKPSTGTGVFSSILYYDENYNPLSDIEPSQYEEGVGVELTAVREKAGYTFDGWYSYDTNEKVTAVPANATGDYAVYAHFTGNQYNIRYFVDGVEDTSLTPKTYTAGTPVSLPLSLSKTWYTFNYWRDNAELEGATYTSISSDTIGDVTMYAKFTPQSFTITYYDDDYSKLSLNPSSYTIETETFTLPTPEKAGYVFENWYTNMYYNGDTVATLPKGSTGYKSFYAKWHVEGPATATDVPYKAADGSGAYHDCKVLKSTVTELADDWYVLNTSVDYGEENGITISGDVKLILADGATLTVEGDYTRAGIYVPVGSSLTIYAQTEGTGAIVATGGDYGAGIGGNMGEIESEPDEGTCGAVVIYGGVIEATGGNGGAGIGGGSYSNGGTVTINDGTVVAIGVGGGAGIGGGSFGDGGDVAINGGTVTAVGGVNTYSTDYHGAGIGGGAMSSDNGSLTIAADLSVKSGDTEESMTVLSSTAGSVTLDGKQYYSVGELEQYDIVYMDGAAPLNLAPAKYTAGQVCELPTPAKSGYTFAGWYTNSNFSSLPVSAIPADATGTKTFYAMWVEGNVGGVPEFTIDANGKLIAADLKGNPEVVIPDVVTEIGNYVFTNLTTLVRVTITANVKAIGYYAFARCTGLEGIAIPGNVKTIGHNAFHGCTALESVTFGEGVESIGEDAFYNTPSLTSPVDGLYIPDSVTNIGFTAFYNTNLDKVSLPGDLYTEGSPLSSYFENATQGKETKVVYRTDKTVFYIRGGWLMDVDLKANTAITIPGSVTQLFPGVFEDCTQIQTVSIPNSVTNINGYAFKGCTGLTDITIPDSVITLGGNAFQGCTSLESAIIGNGVTSIPMYAFSGCTSLESVTIGSGVKSIMVEAFAGCGLTSIVIPDNVTTLQSSAFKDCTALQSAVIGNGLTSIEFGLFRNCSSLSSVTIGSSVTTIKGSAFNGCTSLTELTIPANVTCLEAWALAETGLTSVVIPDSVTQLGNSVFYNCTNLVSATIGSGITSISESLFFNLDSLERVTLRGAVTSIGETAFFDCAALEEINLPSTITSIGDSAFWDCKALAQAIDLPGSVTVGQFAFFGSGITSARVGAGSDIALAAFWECKNLASVNIGGEVKAPVLLSAKSGKRLLGAGTSSTTIGRNAFFGCSDLEEATIGKTVDEIGGGAFGGCSKLTSIIVEDGNDNYKTVDGMLLTKDGATLISGAGNSANITVPDGVTTISDGAFSGFGAITAVTLPSGVTTVGEAAFSNCTALATIAIPASVTTIGANAFCETILATVNVAKGDAARVKALVEGTGYVGAVAYIEPGDEPTEWPEDPSTVEGKTAAEAFGITGELAEAKADDLATWAKANSVDFSNKGGIIADAFLLNCANTAAAVEAAEAVAEEAIKITAITFDSEGNPVLTCPEAYGNGQVVIKGSVEIGASASWHDKTDGDRFFKTVLELK